MITYSDVEAKVMPPEKKAEAKVDLFSYYIGRKISYLITIPLLYTNISPNTITWLSIIMLIISSVVLGIAKEMNMLLIGWLFFFLWNLLDGVDGNIARYKKQFTKLGDTYDTMGGYTAIALIYLSAGIAASHNLGFISNYLKLESEIFIILGALSSICGLFPRLMLHKTMTSLKDFSLVSSVKGKTGKIGFIRFIATNITSITGGATVLLFVSIIYKWLDFFTIFYFLLNLIKMVISLYLLFKSVNLGKSL